MITDLIGEVIEISDLHFSTPTASDDEHTTQTPPRATGTVCVIRGIAPMTRSSQLYAGYSDAPFDLVLEVIAVGRYWRHAEIGELVFASTMHTFFRIVSACEICRENGDDVVWRSVRDHEAHLLSHDPSNPAKDATP
jgi:hypothetical protein